MKSKRQAVTWLASGCMVLTLVGVSGMPVFAAGDTITGTFEAVDGYDVATVRYYTSADKSSYEFATITENADGSYSYSFEKPYAGFAAVAESEFVGGNDASSSATVIAEYFNVNTWDSAVDISWYDKTATEYHIYTPAQLAGVAAIVNGLVDPACEDYMIKGDQSLIESTVTYGGLGGPASDYKHVGLAENDFSNKTIYLEADLDMGGVDGSEIRHTGYNDSKNRYDYPNWTPIGGQYDLDLEDLQKKTTATPDENNVPSFVEAHFNGTLDGQGHHIKNLYCYRWIYPNNDIGVTSFAYTQGVGLVGNMGTLYDGEDEPEISPSIRNLSLSGYIYGRRMTGGFVGSMGGGSNATQGTSMNNGICLENLANHAYVYATDSKGNGGIVGCSMAESGSIINCYNTGNIIDEAYGAPTGGIVGSNEAMDIFACYNTGTISAPSKRGRGIGGTGEVKGGFTVNHCYYLNGCGNDTTYPGFYTFNMEDPSSIETTGLFESAMTDGTMLEGLNANGQAYVAGEDGYPILLWEAGLASQTGSISIEQPQGGTVTASAEGKLPYGTVVYLANQSDTGFNYRYYTANGKELSGDYVTVDGDVTVSAYMEPSVAGVIKIPSNPACEIVITKTGYIINENGETVEVTDYPVQQGDSLYEDDVIRITATLKDGVVPDDESMDYRAAVGLTNNYSYTFTFSGEEGETQANRNYTVDSRIAQDGVTLTVTVTPLTTPKLWTNTADTSWYDSSKSTFTLTNAAQLAGFDKLVEAGTDFAGKTVLLGNDISLKNTDGTSGIRYWNGIGNSGAGFAGTFDGQGYKITDYSGLQSGFFARCIGTASSHAIVKNLSVYGDGSGTNASGIVGYGAYVEISNCDSYVEINGDCGATPSSTGVGGILGYAYQACQVDNCNNYGNISADGYIGGIVGNINDASKIVGSVTNCINKGVISTATSSTNQMGGIVGSNNGDSITACANYGAVIGSGRNIGGLAGQILSGSITDSYNVASVHFDGGSNAYDSLGGLIGYGLNYKLTNCFNYGRIIHSGTSKANWQYQGSLVGRDAKNSNTVFTNNHVLDTADSDGNIMLLKSLADLQKENTTRYATIYEKEASEFASATGVLAAINANNSFVLTNNQYPELPQVAQLHTHHGGKANCVDLAECEECGVAYGNLDSSKHGDLEIKNKMDPVWVYDGNTGDSYCVDCGNKVESGEVLPADKDALALQVVIDDGITQTTIDYSKAEFDALKTVGKPIGYSYGSKSSTIMAAKEYVLLTSLLEDNNISLSDMLSIRVECPSGIGLLTAEQFAACSKYYEDGQVYDAPAAFAISYASMDKKLATVVEDAEVTDMIRFGYGISQEQYENNTSLGGARLISPVEKIIIYTENPNKILGDANMDGQVDAADVTFIAKSVASKTDITDEVQFYNADVNGDGKITREDAIHLARYLAHVISQL